MYLIAIHAILRDIRRSNPLPKTDRRDINLYARGELRSRFPGFGMATSEATRKEWDASLVLDTVGIVLRW